jgi:hypothetical protein
MLLRAACAKVLLSQGNGGVRGEKPTLRLDGARCAEADNSDSNDEYRISNDECRTTTESKHSDIRHSSLDIRYSKCPAFTYISSQCTRHRPPDLAGTQTMEFPNSGCLRSADIRVQRPTLRLDGTKCAEPDNSGSNDEYRISNDECRTMTEKNYFDIRHSSFDIRYSKCPAFTDVPSQSARRQVCRIDFRVRPWLDLSVQLVRVSNTGHRSCNFEKSYSLAHGSHVAFLRPKPPS